MMEAQKLIAELKPCSSFWRCGYKFYNKVHMDKIFLPIAEVANACKTWSKHWLKLFPIFARQAELEVKILINLLQNV